MSWFARLKSCLTLMLLCAIMPAGVTQARLGLLGHSNFIINQVYLPPEDFQFYSDASNPPSRITWEGKSISSHDATRHFWLFLQLSSQSLDGAMIQAADLRRDLEGVLSRAEGPGDEPLRALLTQDVLVRFGEDVRAKGGYFEVILSYDPQSPNPNPVADFQLTYPGAVYFYILAVYNLEMPGATDMIWSDFMVAAFLSHFTAVAGYGEVILEWTTESERDNLGFRILRKCGDEARFEVITEQMIPSASGGHSPAAQGYRYIDEDVVPGTAYTYQLQNIDFEGQIMVDGMVTAVPLSLDTRPEGFQLQQNYPNPFNAATQIHYRITVGSQVSVKIFDVCGELVKVLVAGYQEEGEYTIRWDGQTERDQPAGSGLYFCSLQAGGYHQMMKMVLLR